MIGFEATVVNSGDLSPEEREMVQKMLNKFTVGPVAANQKTYEISATGIDPTTRTVTIFDCSTKAKRKIKITVY
jgi:hypothetical protein